MAEEVLRLLQKETAGLREDLLRHQEEALSQVWKKLRKHMLRRPGRKSQYIFAEKIAEHIDSAMQSLDKEDRVEARALPMEKQRMIKLADQSKLGWAVVAEYKAGELASNSDDE